MDNVIVFVGIWVRLVVLAMAVSLAYLLFGARVVTHHGGLETTSIEPREPEGVSPRAILTNKELVT